MEKRRKRSKNAGKRCEKHRIILRTTDTKTQIGTKKTDKKRRRKLQIDKEKDNEDR
jgi:hypothetical protein